MPNKISFLFWNSRGVTDKSLELFDFINKRKIDVVGVCETFLKPGKKFICPIDYHLIRVDRLGKRFGGLLLLINKKIAYRYVKLNTNLLECVGVEMLCENNDSLFIALTYLPGGADRNRIKDHYESDLMSLTRRNSPFVIFGDLNSHHQMWKCRNSNLAGDILYATYNKCDFLINFPDTPTYVPVHNPNSTSYLDLVLFENSLNCSTPIAHTIMTSDHLPVSFDIFLENLPMSNILEPNYYIANWHYYRKVLNNTLRIPDYNLLTVNPAEIDLMIKIFERNIKMAQSLAIPTQRKCLGVFPSVDLLVLSSRRNYFRRKFNRLHDHDSLMNYLKFFQLSKQEVIKILNYNWETKLKNCTPQNNNLFKIARGLKNKNRSIPSLKQNNVIFSSPLDKVELLGDHFYSAHENELGNKSQKFTKDVQKTVKSFFNTHIDEEINLITYRDTSDCIRRLKNSKSPGIDGINNRLLKNLPPIGITILTVIFNSCLFSGYFPNQWKLAKVIPIPKPGQPKNEANGYRPISLLSSISKVLERLILTRLLEFTEVKNILPEEQFGFRSNHSTSHQILRLFSNAKQNLKNKMSTGIISLDIEKAFDRVWHEGLLYKLIGFGYPNFLIRIVSSYLKNRHFEVHLDNTCSKKYSFPFGVPQGGVLSPSLYNIYISDIPKTTSNLASFADDTALYYSSKFFKKIKETLSKDLKILVTYFTKWKIKINVNKTQALFVTNRRKKQLPTTPITVNKTPIEFGDNLKYLGFIFNNKMNCNLHIDTKLIKVDNLIRMLYPLINRSSVLSTELKIRIYKLYFLPVLLYAYPILQLCSKTYLNKLQVKQNKILKMILNLPWHTSTDFVHQESKIETIKERLDRLTIKFKLKSEDSDNNLISTLYI